MERHEIETFLTLAEELHFARTAERLLVTSGRVSQVIKKLERRVGAPLFDRTSRRVALTRLGRQLRDDIEPHHRAIGEAVQRAAAAAKALSGSLRIGFQGAAAGALLLTVIDAFRAEHPNCAVEPREISFSNPFAALRDGSVDVICTWFPVAEPDLSTSAALMSEARLLAVCSTHPLAGRDRVSLDDLAGEKTFRLAGSPPEAWEGARTPLRTPAGERIERGDVVTTYQEFFTFIAAGRGVAVVSESARRYYARFDIAYVPVHGAPPFDTGLVWRTNSETGLIRGFVETAYRVTAASATAASPPR